MEEKKRKEKKRPSYCMPVVYWERDQPECRKMKEEVEIKHWLTQFESLWGEKGIYF